ncbi:MAG: NifU family protein [Planctomycetes bacterium]|nr:NifU family protein [Planctomycetota bacterium]
MSEDRLEDVKTALAKVRPFLQQDGGDVEFVEMVENEVRVRLKGACSNCPSATITLKMGIEQVLKEEVSQDIEVVQVR